MDNLKTYFKTFVLCLAALVCVAPLASQDAKPSLAVMEPSGNAGVTQMNKMTARGALEQYLVNSRRYRVVDRSRIDQIMKEQSFARDGLVNSANVKEIGKMLQADIVCVSELRKEEGAFIALCSLIDVEGGEVSASAYELIESDTAVEIRNAMNRAAITMLSTGGMDAPPLNVNTAGSASGLKLTVIRVNSFNKVSEVEKALRNITGVDNVTIGDYNNNSRIATIDVATRLSAQELVTNIRNIKLPKLEVVEVSSREIKLAIR